MAPEDRRWLRPVSGLPSFLDRSGETGEWLMDRKAESKWEYERGLLLLERDEMDASHRAVCFALAARGNEKADNIWPNYETLAKNVGLGVSQTHAIVKDLVEAGWLAREHDTEFGRRKTRFVLYLPGVIVARLAAAKVKTAARQVLNSGVLESSNSGPLETNRPLEQTEIQASPVVVASDENRADARRSDVRRDDTDEFDDVYGRVNTVLVERTGVGLMPSEEGLVEKMADGRYPAVVIWRTVEKRRRDAEWQPADPVLTALV